MIQGENGTHKWTHKHLSCNLRPSRSSRYPSIRPHPIIWQQSTLIGASQVLGNWLRVIVRCWLKLIIHLVVMIKRDFRYLYKSINIVIKNKPIHQALSRFQSAMQFKLCVCSNSVYFMTNSANKVTYYVNKLVNADFIDVLFNQSQFIWVFCKYIHNSLFNCKCRLWL